MLTAVSQAACIARRIIIDRVRARKWSFICIILIPFLLSLIPALVGPLLSLTLRTSTPYSTLPQCSSITGTKKCSILLLTVSNKDLNPFGEAIAKSFASELKPPLSLTLEATQKSFFDIMYVSDEKTFEKIRKSNRTLSSCKLTADKKSGQLNYNCSSLHPQFDIRAITSRLDIYISRSSRLLPNGIRLPLRLLMSDLQWFSLDITNMVKMIWPLICVFLMAPILTFLTAMKMVLSETRERQFEHHLRANGLRHPAWILGIIGGLLSVFMTAFFAALVGQFLIGSYWTRLASLPVWLSIWTTLSVAFLSLMLLFRSLGGLLGYIMTVFGVSSGALIALPLSLIDISVNSNVMYIHSFLKLAKSQNKTRIYFHALEVVLWSMRVLFWPLRLPVLICFFVAARALDPNAFVNGRIDVSQVGWSHLLNPETWLPMIHSTVYYYVNLYLPISKIKSTSNLAAFKAFVSKQLDAMCGISEQVSVDFLTECSLWLLSVIAFITISWLLMQVTVEKSPNYDNIWFFVDYSFWFPEYQLEPTDNVTVNLPSGRCLTLKGLVILDNCVESDREALIRGLSDLSITVEKNSIHSSFLSEFRSSSFPVSDWPEGFTCKHAIKFMCAMRGTTFKEFWPFVENHFPSLNRHFDTLISELEGEESAILALILAATDPHLCAVVYDPLCGVAEMKDAVIGFLRDLSKSHGLVIILDGPADEEILSISLVSPLESTA